MSGAIAQKSKLEQARALQESLLQQKNAGVERLMASAARKFLSHTALGSLRVCFADWKLANTVIQQPHFKPLVF